MEYKMKKTIISLAITISAGLLFSTSAFSWNEGGGEQDEATKIYLTFKDKTDEEKAKIREDGAGV